MWGKLNLQEVISAERVKAPPLPPNHSPSNVWQAHVLELVSIEFVSPSFGGQHITSLDGQPPMQWTWQCPRQLVR